MAEAQDGMQVRIYTGGDKYYQDSIERTGLSRTSSNETVGGIKTFTGANVHQGSESFTGPVTFGADSGQILTATATLAAAQIVGNTAGTLGHASGVEVVPAPGAGKALEFIDATLIYDFATAAYTGGDDTMVLAYTGFGTLSGATTKANLLGAAGDKLIALYPLSAAGNPMVVNTGLGFKITTAFTQPGTAAGVCRIQVRYRVITTGL